MRGENLRRRGYILIVTLAIGSLLLLFGTSLVDLNRTHQNLTREHEQALVAEGAAYAGLAQSLYQLKQNADWQGDLSGTQTNSQATYQVRFSGSSAYRSLNNGSGSSAATGWNGKQVPAGLVHLVSVGKCGNTIHVEQMLVNPGSQLLLSTFTTGVDGWRAARGILNPITLLGEYVVGSQASLVPPSEQWNYNGDVAWTDYTVDGELTVTAGAGWGVFFRFVNPGTSASGYRFDYDALTNPAQGGAFMLRKVVNGVPQAPFATVDRSATPFAGVVNWLLNLKHKFKVVVKGTHFDAYVDDVLVVSGDDPANTFPKGMIALRGPLNTVVMVDWIRVRAPMSIKSRW